MGVGGGVGAAEARQGGVAEAGQGMGEGLVGGEMGGAEARQRQGRG